MMIAINQTAYSHISSKNVLAIHQIKTPIGLVTALADENLLYFLRFADSKDLEKRISKFAQTNHSSIVDKKTAPIYSIEDELTRYFDGTLKEFATPIGLLGTDFQKNTWTTLAKIPYGTTCSYIDIATFIGKPSAFRAVARSNSTNPLAIIIPCHRVINANGNLGGYNGGLSKKIWLLDHEKNK